MSFERVLLPIAEAAPTGENLSYDPAFAEIAQLRRRLPATRADWMEIVQRCETLLIERSKDVRLMVWLIEARLLADGIGMLTGGLQALSDLTNLFWTDLHPAIDDEDPEVRLSAYEWLADRLPVLLAGLIFVRTRDERPLSYADYVNAQRLDRLIKRDPQAAERSLARGALRVSEVERLLVQDGHESLAHCHAELVSGHAALERLAASLDGLSGRDAPGFGDALELMSEMAQVFGHLGRQQRATVASKDSVPATPMPASPMRLVTPDTRDEALAQLDLLASRFHQIDPHSPVPYVLDLARRWAAIDLEQLLGEAAIMQAEMPMFFQLMGWSADIRSNPE